MPKLPLKKIILSLTLLSLSALALVMGKGMFTPKTWSTPKAAYQDYLYKRGLVSLLDKGKIIPAKSAKNVECSVLDDSIDSSIQSVSEFTSKKKKVNKVKSVYTASKESKDTLFISQHLSRNDIELSKKCYQVELNIRQRLANVQ